MTKVITRYFDSADQARSVRRELVYQNRFPTRIVRVFDDATDLGKTLTQVSVDAKTATAYEKRVADGGAVVLVEAGFKPLGVARITREVMADMGAADMGGLTEEVFVADERSPMRSVFDDHRLFMTRRRDPSSTTYHMANWPIPLISKRRPYDESVFPRHARMANWPIPLLSQRKPYTGSIFPRHARMAAFPIPLISKRKPYTGSIIPRHGRMAAFPIPLLSKRKPYTGSLIPRHQRMANWPFPHLINGKTGTNALIPGGPRMANFPIPLLSQRKPYTGSIFSRHARMASFPIPLISKRKPFDGSAFPRHARMADVLLPLVIRREDAAPGSQGKGFSFSKLFGWQTVIRR